MMQMKSQKWRNAYLVIYERKNQAYNPKEEDEEVQEEKVPVDDQMIEDESTAKIRIDNPLHPIQQKISLENQNYWQNKFLFGTEYFDFVSEITHDWDTANIIPRNYLNKNNDSHLVMF